MAYFNEQIEINEEVKIPKMTNNEKRKTILLLFEKGMKKNDIHKSTGFSRVTIDKQ